MKTNLKNLSQVLLCTAMLLNSCNKKQAENTTSENLSTETAQTSTETSKSEVFNKNDYSEYFTCTVDGKKYAVGNNADISTAISVLNLGNMLSISTSNGAQTSGKSQEISFRLPSFDSSKPKNYDLSESSPLLVDKLNGTDQHFITTASQPSAIKITEIKDGYLYGHFECTATGVENPAKSIAITDGEFKIKLKEK